MTDLTPNLPEVVAEVAALFERYEQALIDKNVDVLDATFWDSPHTIRYALHENGYGFAEIHGHRVARPPGPGIKEKRIRLEILTLGHDIATVNLEFKVRGKDLIGRQSQSWVRFPSIGCMVISALASTMDAAPICLGCRGSFARVIDPRATAEPIWSAGPSGDDRQFAGLVDLRDHHVAGREPFGLDCGLDGGHALDRLLELLGLAGAALGHDLIDLHLRRLGQFIERDDVDRRYRGCPCRSLGRLGRSLRRCGRRRAGGRCRGRGLGIGGTTEREKGTGGGKCDHTHGVSFHRCG